MNKSDLIERMAINNSLTHSKAEELVDLFFSQVSTTLGQGGRVEIRGFGAFSVKSYGSYTGRNPKTGEKIFVDAKRLPVWRTGLELKERVDSAAQQG